MPVFAWELSLAGWLVVKGFRPERLAALGWPAAGASEPSAVSAVPAVPRSAAF